MTCPFFFQYTKSSYKKLKAKKKKKKVSVASFKTFLHMIRCYPSITEIINKT